MGPSDLAQVLRHLPSHIIDPDLLVGYNTSDDAGVYRLGPDVALVQTVDFFTPIVDDPYDFGRIAAANALSDVYAMGGRPVTVMNLAAFPVGTIDLSVLADILRGGHDTIAKSGAVLVGGHTIDDLEPKYGLSVTGVVHPDKIIRNSTCRPGDVLVLTKPVGAGIAATAIKAGLASDGLLREATEVMAELNKDASLAMVEAGAHACTDITGFGLIGHALEMASSSGVDLVISAGSVPVLSGVTDLAREDVVPGGSVRNFEHYRQWLDVSGDVPEHIQLVLCDAMTSGGLLIALGADDESRLLAALLSRGIKGHVVGCAKAGTGRITLHP